MPAELDGTLRAAGIELCFAEMRDSDKSNLKRFGLLARLGEETFFPTVESAVSGYLDADEMEWEDWEKRRQGGFMKPLTRQRLRPRAASHAPV